MGWKPATEPPEIFPNDWADLVSEPVLVFTKSGSMQVATFEQWLDTNEPAWMTTCSERWDITDDVLFWQSLPEPPAGENS